MFERIYIFSPSIDIDDAGFPLRSTSSRPRGEYRTGTSLLGRAGAAAHRSSTQDYGDVQEVEMKKLYRS